MMNRLIQKRIKVFLSLFFGILFIAAGNAKAQADTENIGRSLVYQQIQVNGKEKISVEFNQVPIEKALRKIAAKVNAGLYFKASLLPEKNVTLTLKKVSVWEAIKAVLKGTGLEAYASGRNIILRKKEILNSIPKKVVIQTGTVSGTVTDAETGEPMPGASVFIEGTTIGDDTDVDGKYMISGVEPGNHVLIAAFIGYERQLKTITINENQIITVNFKLNSKPGMLDEIVVQAYGTTTRRLNTGSISRTTAEEIKKQPVNNLLAAMQGRMPGVLIIPTTGLPGGGYKVRIRGQSSIAAGNAPLFVVDGIPYDSQSLGYSSTTGALFPYANINPLNNISPSEIESIEVLKDADATAIYGSRGANGVILITTKDGVAGKTRYNIKIETAIGHVARFQKLLNTEQYLAMREEAFTNDSITQYPSYAYDINGTWDQDRYTDWQKKLIGESAYRKTIQMDVSGGSEQTHYLLSGEYTTETTVFPGNSDFNRASVYSAINHSDKTGKFDMKLSTHYGLGNNTLPASDLTFQAITLPPNAPALYDKDGSLNWENGTFTNPLSILKGAYLFKRKSLLTNLSIHYQIRSFLGIRLNVGYVNSYLNESRTYPNTVFNPSYGLGPEYSNIFINRGERTSWIAEPQLEWNTDLLGGKLKALAGVSFQQKKTKVLSYFGQGFSSNELIYDLAAASYLQIRRNQEIKYRYEAVYGRLNYGRKGRYFVNLTGRRDGSSRFGPGRKFANFGAIGVAWIFSEEPFFKNSKWLDFGKLRTSYGITGNDQIGDYGYLDTYTVSGTPYGGIVGIAPTQLFNPNFGWEVNKKRTVALEVGLWDNRIFIMIERYSNHSSNQLVGIPLPWTTGFSSMQSNLEAVVENRGWELSLRTINIRKKVSWTTNINLTLPQNELLSFEGLEESTYANQYVIGQPITIKKVLHYIGIDPKTGVYQFEDYNGDGVITLLDDRQFIEDTTPQYYGGIRNVLRYSNWSLSFFIQFSKQKAYNYWYTGSPTGMMVNQPIAVLDHWQKLGDHSKTQIYTTGNNVEATNAFYHLAMSDAAISDASYVRLKSMSISYKSPMKGFDGEIFLQAQNLLTFTHYKGGDPEQINGSMPPLRWISVGLKLTF